MNRLIPKNILETIPNLYDSTQTVDPLCLVKLFTPDSNWTWYIIEYCKEDNDTCYGYVKGLENELGYFSLKELATIKGQLGLFVERDLHFKATKLSTIMSEQTTF